MLRLAIVFGASIVFVIALVVGGVGGSLFLENQDAFCASCHTQPEEKYFQQSQKAQATTLASFHAQKETRCIDCHSGGGPLGRAAGLQQGLDDLVLYLSGHYKAPAITSNPLGDDSCLKCHSDVLVRGRRRTPSQIQSPIPGREGRRQDGHYHVFLQRWQAADPRAGHCVDCHTSHTEGVANVGFMAQAPVQQACDACHRGLNERD